MFQLSTSMLQLIRALNIEIEGGVDLCVRAKFFLSNQLQTAARQQDTSGKTPYDNIKPQQNKFRQGNSTKYQKTKNKVFYQYPGGSMHFFGSLRSTAIVYVVTIPLRTYNVELYEIPRGKINKFFEKVAGPYNGDHSKLN